MKTKKNSKKHNDKKNAKKEAKKALKIKNKNLVLKMTKLYQLSWVEISSFWKPLASVIAVYAIINFIFIASFALLPSSESLQLEVEGLIGENAGRLVSSITLVGVSLYDFSSPSNTILQIILFLISSTAFVWAMRKLRGLKKIAIRQAYYEGPSNLIPLLLVCTMLLFTLIPASIASSVLSFGLYNAGSSLEIIALYAVTLPLIFLSIYWLAVWWPAFYIIMLPGTRPVAAMRAAAELTKYNRAKLFLRHLGIFITLVILFASVAIPASLIWQRIIPLTVYVSVFALFGIMHVMLFTLYRSLVDAKQS